MKIIFAAGGTGGHIYPAIAVAKEILRRDPNSTIRFVGTARGLETKLVSQNGFELSTIDSAGLKNMGLVGKLKGLLILPKSFLEARNLLKEFKPDVVVGAGGYVTGPVLLMASLMKIPTLVMDSNALPGFTNRQLARFVDKAALTFEESLKFFPKKGVVTGNPVRKEFFEVQPKTRGEKINLLIFGGSQGARAINLAMVDALKRLPKDKLNIVHQTGELDFEKIEKGYQDADWQADIRRYITDMVAEFAKADLVVCRAGATTCAELAAAGKVGIMIPLPTAADDHQRKNAEALQNAGAAKMILQADLTGESLAKEIEILINAPEKITEMERNAKKLAKADAAEKAVDIIEQLAVNR
ncbi:MAG: undecaprenyldiphospho-muramoylpentapeptide beta-N-acetylglucosaminyltransferase [Pyrinomonadaceae bacterium]|nr:undecaprenyldiphospho-muramoylpentapeptide beta-N-acetylglucosaminyltransferase [Pyrinomonadaceae bacterium]